MSGDMSSKAERALSRVWDRLFHAWNSERAVSRVWDRLFHTWNYSSGIHSLLSVKTRQGQNVSVRQGVKVLIVWCRSRHVKAKFLSVKGLKVLSPDIF